MNHPRKPGTVRLLSWNIHGSVGLDGRYDPDRVMAAIRRHEPDIVSLQEVHSRGRDPGSRPHDRFAEALGGHLAEACTVRSPDGHYGHVVVSRWPLSGSRQHDLSVDRREPRAAIETTVATPFGDLHVVSVHLGLDIRERHRQARILRAIAAGTGAGAGIVIGDFNDWIWPGPVRRVLSRDFPEWTVHRTFPARLPVLKLDRVYCRPAGVLAGSYVDLDDRFASDHLPVIADVDPAGGRDA